MENGDRREGRYEVIAGQEEASMKLESMFEYVTLVKEQSFTDAARKLYLSQSTLSSHIIAMEKELGFPLIDRSEKTFNITPAGATFLEYAQQAIEQYAEAKDRCVQVAGRKRPVRIHSFSPVSPYYRALDSLLDESYTFVDLDLETPLFAALTKGIVDISLSVDFTDNPALMREAVEKGIAYLPTGTSRSAICLMRSNPLASKPSLTRSDLYGRVTLINSGANFDSWKHAVLRMLGDDVGLEFRVSPVRHISNLVKIDLGDCLHICGLEAVRTWFGQRDDMVIFEQLDGKDMLHSEGFAYLKANERAETLALKLCEVAQERSVDT
ncbi:MAG: LysR family transcriptional regulator [Coriobacteriales bacterium]|jgi:DNA-binding transcriptional LysR family regulator|nr:LysR family transcriptional regulator [Coriobacteriales bacterium]